MKKSISILLSIILILTAFPFYCFATEQDTAEREELIALACEVFPEYCDAIQGQAISTYTLPRSTDTIEEVFTETRNISDTTTLTYTQYSDGSGILTQLSTTDGCEKDVTYDERHASAGATYSSITIEATYTGESTNGYGSNGYFKLTGLEYVIMSGDYDYIGDIGRYSVNSDCRVISNATICTLNESASGPAILQYRLNFKVGSNFAEGIESNLRITVGNDSAIVTHNKR